MKRAEVLLSLAGIVMATSYITGNPAVGLVGSAIIAHYSLARAGFRPKIRIKRSVPERGTEREPLKAMITVENLSGTSGVLRIRETSKKVFSKEIETSLKAFEKKRIVQTIVPQGRGRIPLKTSATFTDELGLFKKEIPVEEQHEITVFPSPESIREAMTERRQVHALAETERALGVGSETMEFEELREFMPGDDVTRIDWKATSRLQKLVIRVFKRETLANVYILINVDPKFRREMLASRVDYLVVILAQLTAYFRRFGHTVKVIAYDDSGIVKSVQKSGDPVSILKDLNIGGEKGIPPLRPSVLSSRTSLGRRILHIKTGSESSGIVKAAMKPEPGSYVIVIDDIGLHPAEVIKATRLLARRGSKSVVVYPNPVLFLNREALNRKTIESAYRAYRERKELVKRVVGYTKVVEVGPNDLLPRVVRRL